MSTAVLCRWLPRGLRDALDNEFVWVKTFLNYTCLKCPARFDSLVLQFDRQGPMYFGAVFVLPVTAVTVGFR